MKARRGEARQARQGEARQGEARQDEARGIEVKVTSGEETRADEENQAIKGEKEKDELVSEDNNNNKENLPIAGHPPGRS